MLNEYKFRDNEERNIFIFRFIILFVLWIWAFWSNITIMANVAINTSEMAHNLIFPIAVILLIYRRRSELLYNINRGSNWGLAIMIVGIIVSAASAWPFSFGYIQQLAIVPILAGAIIAALGWKVFKISVPMLILIILAIPIGVRLYASLIIIPETITISAVSKTLSLIGINANISGTDIIYSSGQNAGILAMGESNRGSRLLLAYAFIGVFVIFYEHRTVWKIIIPIIVSIPIIFFSTRTAPTTSCRCSRSRGRLCASPTGSAPGPYRPIRFAPWWRRKVWSVT